MSDIVTTGAVRRTPCTTISSNNRENPALIDGERAYPARWRSRVAFMIIVVASWKPGDHLKVLTNFPRTNERCGPRGVFVRNVVRRYKGQFADIKTYWIVITLTRYPETVTCCSRSGIYLRVYTYVECQVMM